VDTHVLLWAMGETERLSRSARIRLESTAMPIYFSIASLWEIAIKVSTGKLRLEVSIRELALGARERGLRFLPLRIAHAMRIATLPFHHRDPFDRMLIAQAMEHHFEVITKDPAFPAYDVRIVW